jgi:hypothetical protein
MEKKKIIAVGLGDADKVTLENLLDDVSYDIFLAFDLAAGLEKLKETNSDLLLVETSTGDVDPLDVVAVLHQKLKEESIPIALIRLQEPREALIIDRHPVSNEFRLTRPKPGKEIEAIKRALSSHESEDVSELDAARDTEVELREIGFSDWVEIKGDSLLVQTEVHLAQKGVTIRNLIFKDGSIVNAVSTPYEPDGDLVEQTRERAKAIHQKNLQRVKSGA